MENDKPGINGEEFKVQVNKDWFNFTEQEFVLGEDFEISNESSGMDENGGWYSYQIRPISDRCKKFFFSSEVDVTKIAEDWAEKELKEFMEIKHQNDVEKWKEKFKDFIEKDFERFLVTGQSVCLDDELLKELKNYGKR